MKNLVDFIISGLRLILFWPLLAFFMSAVLSNGSAQLVFWWSLAGFLIQFGVLGFIVSLFAVCIELALNHTRLCGLQFLVGPIAATVAMGIIISFKRWEDGVPAFTAGLIWSLSLLVRPLSLGQPYAASVANDEAWAAKMYDGPR
jgi:hypothetical protein